MRDMFCMCLLEKMWFNDGETHRNVYSNKKHSIHFQSQEEHLLQHARTFWKINNRKLARAEVLLKERRKPTTGWWEIMLTFLATRFQYCQWFLGRERHGFYWWRRRKTEEIHCSTRNGQKFGPNKTTKRTKQRRTRRCTHQNEVPNICLCKTVGNCRKMFGRTHTSGWLTFIVCEGIFSMIYGRGVRSCVVPTGVI